MLLVSVCTECGEWVEVDGPDGILAHVIAFHPRSDLAQRVMRELAHLPLPVLPR